MGNMRCHPGRVRQYAGERSSKTVKGAAVKVFQHTQLPFDSFFINWQVNSIRGLPGLGGFITACSDSIRSVPGKEPIISVQVSADFAHW
jgi:hypothetical protein